ncbi:MAG TPA: bacteriohemerythrin [Bryobacteraceae bacterium]|nr:bacteriohemerythrin [Bryobacteraceae bacterium]
MASTNVLFPWKDAYSVGIPRIDTQHKGLIALINELHAAMTEGRARTAMAPVMDELADYTARHFAYEESLLRQNGYSALAEHQELHRKLTAQALELRDKLRAGKLTVTIETMQFLKNWLANHILSADIAYSRELHGKATGGIAAPRGEHAGAAR